MRLTGACMQGVVGWASLQQDNTLSRPRPCSYGCKKGFWGGPGVDCCARVLDILCWTPPHPPRTPCLSSHPASPHPALQHSSSVSAKVSAEAEAQRLRADNLALEASLRKMMEKEVRVWVWGCV